MPTREATIALLSGFVRNTFGEMSIRPGSVPRHALGIAGGKAGVADGGSILPFARQLRICIRLARFLKHYPYACPWSCICEGRQSLLMLNHLPLLVRHTAVG